MTITDVDLFYKVRDRIDAYTDLEMTHSVLYKKKQREGKYKKDVIVYFDWDKEEASYAIPGKVMKPIAILPGSFDPDNSPPSRQGQQALVRLDLHQAHGKQCVRNMIQIESDATFLGHTTLWSQFSWRLGG